MAIQATIWDRYIAIFPATKHDKIILHNNFLFSTDFIEFLWCIPERWGGGEVRIIQSIESYYLY